MNEEIIDCDNGLHTYIAERGQPEGCPFCAMLAWLAKGGDK